MEPSLLFLSCRLQPSGYELKISYDLTFVFVAVAAALLGAAFPIISHASIDPDRSGWKETQLSVRQQYHRLCAGKFHDGFVAMDHLSTTRISFLLLTLGLLMAIALVASRPASHVKGVLAGGLAGSVLLSFLLPCCSFPQSFERLMFRADYRSQHGFRERCRKSQRSHYGRTKMGLSMEVVFTMAHSRLTPPNDTNSIFRAFAIAAIHPNPRHVLVIGLSSGSWTQVLVNHPNVEDATVVEINPGLSTFDPATPGCCEPSAQSESPL